LHDNFQRESHKPYGPPTSVTWLQLLRQQTGTSTALQKYTDPRTQDIAQIQASTAK